MAHSNNEHWSDYWRQGRLTSLPQDFSANYDGEIASFWQAQFTQLSDQATVLDLCTGNGAIALLATHYAATTGIALQVTAVDAAELDLAAIALAYPNEAPLLATIRFVAPCRVEEIDLPSASYDLICSQYGIEYCDWQAAATQVERLLRPGGDFVLICHASDSDILETMKREKSEYELLARLQLGSLLKQWLGEKIGFRKFVGALPQIIRQLSTAGQAHRSALWSMVINSLNQLQQMDESVLRHNRDNLARFASDLKQGESRLDDMLRVNLAIQAEPDWFRVFERAGLTLLDAGEVVIDGKHHAGRSYRFQK